jgi:hypothetical protein
MSVSIIELSDAQAVSPLRIDNVTEGEKEAFIALNKTFIEAGCGYVFAENNKQKSDIIKAYRKVFTSYVQAGLPLNLCSTDVPIDDDMRMGLSHIKEVSSRWLRQSPIWFASLCFIELSLLGINSLEKRNKDLSALFLALENRELSFKMLTKESAPITGSRSFSGLASMSGLWATAAWVAKRDPFLKTAEVSIFYSCIESSAVAKKIDIAIEVMNLMYKIDKDIDRASSINGLTALMRAAAYTNIPLCTWLLERGANINQPDAATHATPIMHALDRKFGLGDFSNRKRIKDTLDFLIKNGADITLTPLTGEDFGKLIINCLSLKGEDRKYYKDFWRNYKKSLPSSNAKEADNLVTIENLVTQADVIAFDKETGIFRTASYSMLLTRLIDYLVFERNILRFTLMDIVTLLEGMESKVSVADLSKRNIEKQLNKLISGAKRGINLTRDANTGFFIVLSDSQEGNVVAVNHE